MGFFKEFAIGFGSILGLIIAYNIIVYLAGVVTQVTGLDGIWAMIIVVIFMMLIGFAYGWFYLYPKVKGLSPAKQEVVLTDGEVVDYVIKKE